MARQMNFATQAVTVALTTIAVHIVAVEILPMTRLYIYGSWIMPLLAMLFLLCVYAHAAIRYRIKPPLWLLGIPLSCLLCHFWYIEGLYGCSNIIHSYQYGRVPVYVFCLLIPVTEWLLAILIHKIQVRRWRQGEDITKEVSLLKQIVSVILFYCASIYLWQNVSAMLFWRFGEQWVIECILALLSLTLFLFVAIVYGIRPWLWLIGIPVLLGLKFLFFPNDISELPPIPWQQRLPTMVIYAVVPIIFCIAGYVIHAIQVRRWRGEQ